MISAQNILPHNSFCCLNDLVAYRRMLIFSEMERNADATRVLTVLGKSKLVPMVNPVRRVKLPLTKQKR